MEGDEGQKERKTNKPLSPGCIQCPDGRLKRGCCWGSRGGPVPGSAASLVHLLQQQKVDLLEGGPLLGVSSPAAEHQLIHGVRANGRLREVSLWKQKMNERGDC